MRATTRRRPCAYTTPTPESGSTSPAGAPTPAPGPAPRDAARIRPVPLQRPRPLRLRPRPRIAAHDPVRPVGADQGARGVGAAFRVDRNVGGQAPALPPGGPPPPRARRP